MLRLCSIRHSCQVDDADLARRILAAAPASDATAESELCRRFAPRIRLYGLRHLRSEAAAADLTQEVLLDDTPEASCRRRARTGEARLLHSRDVPTGRGRWAAQRLAARADSRHVRDGSDLHSSKTTPTRSMRTACTSAWSAYPSANAAVLVMTFYDDQPADAVGLDLGLSAGNVRVIRHRGIERLKACVQVAGNKPYEHGPLPNCLSYRRTGRVLAGRAGRSCRIGVRGTLVRMQRMRCTPSEPRAPGRRQYDARHARAISTPCCRRHSSGGSSRQDSASASTAFSPAAASCVP